MFPMLHVHVHDMHACYIQLKHIQHFVTRIYFFY